jgi:hypothetical protein
MIDSEIFAAGYLDLAPLRGQRRGVTFCPFHTHRSRTPSFSVDLDRRVFCCHACGERGGYRRFAELIGEAPIEARRAAPVESEAHRAWAEVLQRERVLEAGRAAWASWMLANDRVRAARGAVDEARRWARILGPEDATTWPLLALAARAEIEALLAEVALDQLLEEGRLALDQADRVDHILAAVSGRRP